MSHGICNRPKKDGEGKKTIMVVTSIFHPVASNVLGIFKGSSTFTPHPHIFPLIHGSMVPNTHDGIGQNWANKDVCSAFHVCPITYSEMDGWVARLVWSERAIYHLHISTRAREAVHLVERGTATEIELKGGKHDMGGMWVFLFFVRGRPEWRNWMGWFDMVISLTSCIWWL